MARLMNWLARLLGLQSMVEEVIESNLRMHTAVAGAVAHAEAVKEAERYAADLEKTHPQLAAHLRRRIAEVVGTTTTAQVALPAEPSPAPALPEALPKPNGRPKKSPPPTTPTPPAGA